MGRRRKKKLLRGRPSDADLRILDYAYRFQFHTSMCDYPLFEKFISRHGAIPFRIQEAIYWMNISHAAAYRALRKLIGLGLIKKGPSRGSYTVPNWRLQDPQSALSYMEKRIKELPLLETLRFQSECALGLLCTSCLVEAKKRAKEEGIRETPTLWEEFLLQAKLIEDVSEKREYEPGAIFGLTSFKNGICRIKQSPQCPNCGNYDPTLFVHDHETLEITCKKCGFIHPTPLGP